MSTVRESFLIAVFIGALTAPATWGQQQAPDQPAPPIPAIHSPLASAADNGEADDTAGALQKLVPDNRPLAGVQDLSIGAPATTHSYWQPHIDVSSTADSNPLSSSGTPGWTSWTSFVGGVDLHRDSGNSAMMLNYVGGGTFSNGGNVSNGVVQGLNFSDRYAFRRSAISFFNQLMYAPQTFLGSGLPGGPTLPGGGSPGLGAPYTPGQSILTTRGQRITNSSFAEFDVFLTPRSSLTFVGGYSLLDSFENSQLNYGNIILTGGYNHQMTRLDTIAVSYQFSSFQYSDFNQSIQSNTVYFSYARRVTGKLAFQISAGPTIAFFGIPITTTSGSTGGTGSSTNSSTMQVFGALNASLQFQLRRVVLGAAYNHGINPGSGVLAGSVTDTVTGSASRQLSRTFNGSWNFGYSRNRGLAVNGSTTSNQTYGYWFTGANLSHPWGRSMNLFLSYQLQYQNSNASFCTGTTCGTSVTRNQITFGLGWHRQPSPF